MKRMACALLSVAGMAGGMCLAQTESKDMRFEVSAETGLATILSGPDMSGLSNTVARFGFSPSHNFQLSLTYTKLTGELAKDDDVLGSRFEELYLDTVNSKTSFRDADLDDREVDLTQIELGLVKTIPLGSKKWESFMGVGFGLQNASADVSWTGAFKSTGQHPCGQDPPPLGTVQPACSPTLRDEQSSEFFTSVRGGIRFVPRPWVAAQLNLRILPIAKMLGEDYNSLELNLGVVFRFSKF